MERESGNGDITEVSLYEDIFEYGFVQSITPAQHRFENIPMMGGFHIFYYDGFGNNKSFRIDTFRQKGQSHYKIDKDLDDNDLYLPIDQVVNVKDLDEPFHNKIVDNNYKVKWSLSRSGGDFRFYAYV